MIGKSSPKVVAGLIFLAFAVSMLISVPSGLGAENNITVTLTLNNTDNIVYVPGVGPRAVSESAATWYSPVHNYIASYLNDILYGVVLGQGNPGFIRFGKTSGSHSITLQGGKTSTVFVSFTRGDWTAVENRISLIEAGGFLSKISPSFSYGLGIMRTIKILLAPKDINILNDLILNPGTHAISVEYPYAVGGKPAIYINRSI